MMVSRKNVEISAKIHEGEFRELLHCVAPVKKMRVTPLN